MKFAKNLFITGLPGSGKTTLVKNISRDALFRNRVGGFFTEEIRSEGTRTGFKIVTIPEGSEGILARKNLISEYRVGSYGVYLKDLEKLACGAVLKAVSGNQLVIIDEIGKMELFSKKFKKTLIQALNSHRKVLATVLKQQDPFADELKKRPDVCVYELSQNNFDFILKCLKSWIGLEMLL